ncbi:MAG TPA: cation transporter [Spirochaetia bacterium]|jgi:Cu+-exporting ATPase|nr:cation transporter [Spirochaetia bacterium]
MKIQVSIEGMTCGHCVARVEKALQGVPGAAGVKVDLKKNRAELEKNGVTEDQIRAAVTEAGYSVTGISEAKGGFSLFRS